jgi:multiple sugar transport system ATP-binding protein
MARVLLENISKTYTGPKRERLAALRGFSLDVADGECVVILGPSGCGKTTTLRLIAGLEELDAGGISIDGRRMNGVEPHERDVAMVFQQPALYPHMTAYENIAFGLKLRKIPAAEIERRVHCATEILSLTARVDHLPKDLSGGERQRVSIGRAMVREPKVFLFDEPLTHLDATLRNQMRGEIAKLHRALRATTIYVTHDQSEAMAVADRIVVMNAGEIQQVGTPEQITRQPANEFVAGFLDAGSR